MEDKNELGIIIDTMKELKDAKDVLRGKIKDLQIDFDNLELQLIEEMKFQKLEKAAGKLASATLKIENYPSVKDKEQFYLWVVRENHFEFTQSRINAAAFRELFEQKNVMPDGVETYLKEKINMRKRW